MVQTTAATQPSVALVHRSSTMLWSLFVVAFLARLVPVLGGGGLRGILGYDDGVYFGAADALLSGRLPYRDFLLLHPPGVLLVLAPFAALGRLTSDPVGLATARVVFMAIGAVSAVLVYWVARRAGRVAAVTSGGLYALWGPAAYAERTTLLEPLVNLGLLVALVALGDVRVASRRRLLVAGTVLGAATAVKLWAAVPLVVLAVWVLRRRGLSAGAGFVAASALAASVVCLPFFWAAPGRMFRMVVRDQLGRPDNAVSTWQRLAGIAGHANASVGATAPAAVIVAATASLALVVAAAVVVGREPQLRVWVALLALQAAVLLTGPAYYDHYATFVAPALCLVMGSAIGLVVAHVDVRWRRPLPVVAVTCLALALLAVVGPVHRQGRRVPVERVAEVLGTVRCVRADSTAALVSTNVLTRDLRRGCPLALDITGVTYDVNSSQLPDGRPGASRRADAAWQRFLGGYVNGANAFLVVQAGADGFGPGLRALFRAQTLVLRVPHLLVYRTTSGG
jgi:alpha-1,2-mannosyltransferase